MQRGVNAVMAKNLFVCTGAYYLSGWLSLLLALGFGKLTQGLIFHDAFGIAVLQPMVMHLPRAIAAAIAGAAVVWLVESEQPIRWVMLPALLYIVQGYMGYHWGRPPVFIDRVAQTVGAVFPSLACAAGAAITRARRNRSAAQPSATPS